MTSQVFEVQVRNFSRRSNQEINRIVRETIFKIADRIVEKSPVGDPTRWRNPESAPPGYVGGHFRANWQYYQGNYRVDEVEGTQNTAVQRVIESVPQQAAGKVHYIVNSVHYAKRIEDGHSHIVAPHGVVRTTIAEFPELVRSAIRD